MLVLKRSDLLLHGNDLRRDLGKLRTAQDHQRDHGSQCRKAAQCAERDLLALAADGCSFLLHLPLRRAHKFFALMLALIFLLAAQSALAFFVGRIVSEIAIDSSAVAAVFHVLLSAAGHGDLLSFAYSLLLSALFCDAQLCAAGAGIFGKLFLVRHDGLSRNELYLRFSAAHAHREFRRADAALCKLLELFLNNAVLERVERNDRKPSAAFEVLLCRVEHRRKLTQLVVHGDADGLKAALGACPSSR